MDLANKDVKKMSSKRKNGLFVAKVFFGDPTAGEGMIFDPNKGTHIDILKRLQETLVDTVH